MGKHGRQLGLTSWSRYSWQGASVRQQYLWLLSVTDLFWCFSLVFIFISQWDHKCHPNICSTPGNADKTAPKISPEWSHFEKISPYHSIALKFLRNPPPPPTSYRLEAMYLRMEQSHWWSGTSTLSFISHLHSLTLFSPEAQPFQHFYSSPNDCCSNAFAHSLPTAWPPQTSSVVKITLISPRMLPESLFSTPYTYTLSKGPFLALP